MARHFALADDRRLGLADLVALRQVGIEIILPLEHRFEVDPGLETETRSHRLSHAFGIDDRQHARHGGIDQRDVRVRLPPNSVDAPENSLAFEVTWAWNFEPDDEFPVAGRAFDQLLRGGREGHHETEPAREMATREISSYVSRTRTMKRGACVEADQPDDRTCTADHDQGGLPRLGRAARGTLRVCRRACHHDGADSQIMPR